MEFRQLLRYYKLSRFYYFNSNSNINDDISFLYLHINIAINHFIPKQRRHKLIYPIWFSKELKILIKQKQIAHLAYKTLNLPESYISFSNFQFNVKISDIVIIMYILITFKTHLK